MGANSSRAERCRLKAEECRLMAERARDPKTKADLLDLARQWLRNFDIRLDCPAVRLRFENF
jgi:hypothetical protein